MTDHDVDGRDARPAYCPNPACHFHRERAGWRWVRDGCHRRRAPPVLVQRFRCGHCRHSFSVQSFRATYWLKRPDLLPRIFRQLGAGSGYRQVGRVLDCAHSTVLNQARRLGRHCLLYQHHHAPPAPPDEPLVLDGLRSFEFSQYWPFDLNHLTGARSRFVYGFNLAELRRSGAMTERQHVRRAELEHRFGRPDPQATRRQVEVLLGRVTARPCALELHSDQHGGYVQAVRRLRRNGWTVRHRQTSSRAARTPRNPLWPANLLDLLIRHASKNHARETIAFSKRAQSVLLRAAVFQVERNWVGGVRVRDGRRSPSPAMQLGLARRRQAVDDVLRRRLRLSRVGLPADLREVYRERIPTRQLPRLRRHELRYAV